MAECLGPIRIRNPHFGIKVGEFYYNSVPCGRCIHCLQRKSREWIFRIKEELKSAVSAYFVTLTYADENLPIVGFKSDQIPNLSKQDLRDYIRSLRKQQAKQGDKTTIRYFACGEYGTLTRRPHYHIILLNSYQKLIQDTWIKGTVHVGTVTSDSIAYNTKYLLKENASWEDQMTKEIPGWQRSFSAMSKGIGKNYLKPETIRHHKANLDSAHLTDAQGYIYAMPRYYKEKIYTEEEQAIVNKQAKKRIEHEAAEQHAADLLKEAAEINPFAQRIDSQSYKTNNAQKKIKQSNKKL